MFSRFSSVQPSPDLNPCDYFLWRDIGQEITKLGLPDSKNYLMQQIHDIVDAIPQSMINSVTNNFNKHADACANVQDHSGWHI